MQNPPATAGFLFFGIRPEVNSELFLGPIYSAGLTSDRTTPNY
jgi:hypothetical protein